MSVPPDDKSQLTKEQIEAIIAKQKGESDIVLNTEQDKNKGLLKELASLRQEKETREKSRKEVILKELKDDDYKDKSLDVLETLLADRRKVSGTKLSPRFPEQPEQPENKGKENLIGYYDNKTKKFVYE